MGKHTIVTGPSLKILVVKAVGLPAADIGGTSDPYVQIQVGHDYGWNPKVWKTSKIKKTLNPIWNEEFIVPVSSPEKDGIRFAVFDYDMIGSDDLLGQVVFPSLHKLQMGVPTEAILNLAGVKSSRGTIHVVLTAMNFGVQPTQVVVQQNIVAAPPPQQVVQQTTTYQQPMVQQQTTTTTGYATPPPANPYGAPGGNPYGAAPIPGYGAPLGAQVAQANYNPYGQQQNFNPYGQQQPQQQYNPYGQQQQQPQQQYNPYGQQQQPQQTYNPYGQQQQQPQQQYGGSPYGGPPAY